MDSHSQLEVADWRDSPRPIASKARAPRLPWSPTIIGLIGTVALHSLIVPSAFLGNGASKARPPEIQVPGSAVKSNPDAADSIMLISLPPVPLSSQKGTQAIVSLAALTKVAPILPINTEPSALVNIEALTIGEEQATSVDASSNGTERARLFGIYTGQIQARIDRVWRRPRSPVNGNEAPTDESFRCRAQIVQDAKGNVQEVLLLRCNGSLVWQRSLVIAIQQASPLPAPPSAAVFSRSITLDFLGLPYVPGSTDDDYELEQRHLQQQSILRDQFQFYIEVWRLKCEEIQYALVALETHTQKGFRDVRTNWDCLFNCASGFRSFGSDGWTDRKNRRRLHGSG